MKTVLIAYVPVLHEGYRQLFLKYKSADLYILGQELIGEFTHLQKEIRQLAPEIIQTSIEKWGIEGDINILNKKELTGLQDEDILIVVPDEDIMQELVVKYLNDKKVQHEPLFLRWDKHKSMEERPVEVDQKISKKEFDKNIIKRLKQESEKSSDWWRRIGAAVIKEGKIILVSHNEHQPSPHSPWALGDPRNNFHKGVGIEYSTSIHAEAKLVAEAARQGLALDGCDMYVTVFPCPACAKQIAFAGIKRLFYAGGYSVLDQERVLKSKGIEIIYIEN